jgi:hypothetical protein
LRERVPSAELVVLDEAGHVPMWDRPERVTEVILEVTVAVDRDARDRSAGGGTPERTA